MEKIQPVVEGGMFSGEHGVRFRAFINPRDRYKKIADTDAELIEITDQDPTGRFLLQRLCTAIDARTDWSDEDRTLVDEAIELAYELHGDTDRGNGDRYVTHVLRVAIDLCEQGESARLVGAALLHDSAEESPDGIVDYVGQMLMSAGVITSIEPAGPTENDRANHALATLAMHPFLAVTTPLVDGVTNRSYPLAIDAIDDPKQRRMAQLNHRAGQIIEHIRRGHEEAVLKFADTRDNIRGLSRHEFFANPSRENYRHLAGLIEKYTMMIEQWEANAHHRPGRVTTAMIDLSKMQLQYIEELQDARVMAVEQPDASKAAVIDAAYNSSATA